LGGIATLTNVTLSGNSAGISGGGLVSIGTGTITVLAHVTLSGNSAGTSGGANYRSNGTVRAYHSIVANSPSGMNCFGSVLSDGFNLSSDTSCGLFFNTVPNLVLGPLTDNGGPTKTHMPLPGSPAIDYVANGCPPPATDQRGAPRNVDACDAGAVEFGALLPRLHVPLARK
jgi:hypothetical protein